MMWGGWLLAALLLSATGAGAYVRTTSDRSGVPVQWLQSCILVRPDSRGSQDVSIDQIESTLARSVTNWASRTLSCSYLRLQAAKAARVQEVGIDSQPSIVFRDKVWARPGSSVVRDPSIIALTTVFYVDTPGYVGDASILDADIELNGVNYTFTIDNAGATPRPNTELADLENTLTHELGHVQGLGHTCWDHIKEMPPRDHLGQPIPDCNLTLPQSILETTMYPYPLMEGETSKRDLAQDDIDGICAVYPATDPVPACHQELNGGCDLAPHPVPTPWPALLLLGLLVRRRA
jgi:hypothetical protein